MLGRRLLSINADYLLSLDQAGAPKARLFAIVSVDQLNQTSLGLSLAVPLTRTDFGSALHLAIPASEGGLGDDGFAMPEQLRAISHERLSRRLGSLRPKTLEELLRRCRVLLR